MPDTKVVIDGITYVRQEDCIPEVGVSFKVGDFVRAKNPYGGMTKGLVGYVRVVNPRDRDCPSAEIGVEFMGWKHGHALNGRVIKPSSKSGYYFPEAELTHATQETLGGFVLGSHVWGCPTGESVQYEGWVVRMSLAGSVGVYFEEFNNGHDLDGTLESGSRHGWYFNASDIGLWAPTQLGGFSIGDEVRIGAKWYTESAWSMARGKVVDIALSGVDSDSGHCLYVDIVNADGDRDPRRPVEPTDVEHFVPLKVADFQVGDFVSLSSQTRSHEGMPQIGWTGKVVEITLREVGVEFWHSFKRGHECGGEATDAHGWYFTPRESSYRVEEVDDIELLVKQ